MMERSPPRTLSEPDLPASTRIAPIVTQRDKRRKLSGNDHDDLTAFKMEMKELFQSFSDIQNKRLDSLEKLISDVKKSTSSISKTNLEIEQSVNFVSDQIKTVEEKITKLEEERKSISCQLFSMEEKCEEIERNCTKTCIEIRNVPKPKFESKENLFQSAAKLCNLIDVPLQNGDIRDVYRIPNKNDKAIGTLIIESSNTLTKKRIIVATKDYNKKNRSTQLSSMDIGIEGPAFPIFVSEHLTPKGRRLHFLARDFAKSESYAYCWTANGRVYLRKSEGAPHILLKNESQLNDLKKM